MIIINQKNTDALSGNLYRFRAKAHFFYYLGSSSFREKAYLRNPTYIPLRFQLLTTDGDEERPNYSSRRIKSKNPRVWQQRIVR